MKMTPDRRNALDERLAALLAAGGTYAQAAAGAGCSERHVLNRLKDPAFKALVDAARHRVIDLAVGRLAEAAAGAVATLVAVLGDRDNPGARVSAARAILKHVVDLQNHQELAERVAELEARVGQHGGAP